MHKEYEEDPFDRLRKAAQEKTLAANEDPVAELSKIEERCQKFFTAWTTEKAVQVMEERYGTHHIDHHVKRLQRTIDGLTEYREVLQGMLARKRK